MNLALGQAFAAGKLSNEGLVRIMEECGLPVHAPAPFMRGLYCVGQTEEEIATEEETLP